MASNHTKSKYPSVDARPHVHKDLTVLMNRLRENEIPFQNQKPYRLMIRYPNRAAGISTGEFAMRLHMQLHDHILQDTHYLISSIQIMSKLVVILLVPDWAYWFKLLMPEQSERPPVESDLDAQVYYEMDEIGDIGDDGVIPI